MLWGKPGTWLGADWGKVGQPWCFVRRGERGAQGDLCPWAEIPGKSEARTTFLKPHEGDELVRGACGRRLWGNGMSGNITIPREHPSQPPGSIPRTSIRSILSWRVRTASSSSRTAGGSSGG